MEYESVTIGYVLKSEYYLPDNTSVIEHFLRDPFEPLTHPLERRRRNALPGVSDQHKTYDIQNQRNDTENNSTSNDHYEKYDVEAVQVSTGVTNNYNGDDEGHDSQYYGDWNEEEDEEYSPAEYRITKQNDFATARWTLYKGIETIAERLSF